jgi:hypothetical protein
MDYTEIRKLSLKVFLGFLGLTALIAIISVLSGQFGKIQFKILATCSTISAASICSMSCAAFIERKRLKALGLSGILLSLLSACLLIVGIWSEMHSEGFWKTSMTLVVGAVSFAHAFLLALPELNNRQKWIQTLSSISIGVLALLIVVALWGEIQEDGYYRLLTVVAIIVGLETLSIPIVMKLQKGTAHKAQKLVLEKLKGDIYQDSTGRKYQLKEID